MFWAAHRCCAVRMELVAVPSRRCPLCRYALPTEGKALGEEQRLQQERKELHEAMYQ